jgi:methyltransferase
VTSWQIATIQLIILVGCARVLELVSSALKAMATGRRAAPERWWWAIVAVHVLVLGGSLAAAFVNPDPPPRPIIYGALGALVVATALRAWVLATLRGRWDVRVVDPDAVATNGPYRFIRHPNYLAVILEVAAIPVLAGAYALAFLATIANAVVLSLRIPYEERMLSARHRAYRDELMRRPRFLPRP